MQDSHITKGAKGTHDSLIIDEDEVTGTYNRKQNQDGDIKFKEIESSVSGLSQLSLSAIESREVDAEKVKLLLSIKDLSQDQALAGDRRKLSSSYLGTGRTVGDKESKDIRKLLHNLHQQTWKKNATTGNAEPLLRARRDVELCDAVQRDMALCVPSARAPALLWSSMPPKNARRLGSLDMMSDVLEGHKNKFSEIPVAQDLETCKRVTFLGPNTPYDSSLEFYSGQVRGAPGVKAAPGSPIGLNHSIAQKKVGDIHAEIQVSPVFTSAVHLPEDSETCRKMRSMWPAASGIGSLGPTFGTSRSLFEIKDHGIQEDEMCPEDAYDVATLAKCTDYPSVDDIAAPSDPRGKTTDGLRTVSPQRFGIRTFAAHPHKSMDSPVAVRSPDREGRPVGFDMQIEQTHPQQRSPRQHRRSLNLERGPGAHDEKHRMARSVASFRDIVPSMILNVTSNYQEFFPVAKEMTTAAARASALPFIVNNNCLLASSNTRLPAVYYTGDGVLQPDSGLAKSKAAVEANDDVPKLPHLVSSAPPVFSVNGAAIPSTAVAVRQMVGQHPTHSSKISMGASPVTSVMGKENWNKKDYESLEPLLSARDHQRLMTSSTALFGPGTARSFSRPGTRDQPLSFTPPSTWFTMPNTPNNPAKTGVVFINKVGDVNQDTLDSFYPHFEEYTLGHRFEQRHGGGVSVVGWNAPETPPRTSVSRLSLPSASSATRGLQSSDTSREIRTADLKDWRVPHTPPTTFAPPYDPLRPRRSMIPKKPENLQNRKKELRTPHQENTDPPALKKADPLRDLLEAREGFKAQKKLVAVVDIAINEGGHGFWDCQTLWCVGGLLIWESEPVDQLVTLWQSAQRGTRERPATPGRYIEQMVKQSKLTRAFHVDEIVLLQERALQDQPFAIDVVSAEMQGIFKSKFIWKKGVTPLYAGRGDVLRVYRAQRNGNNIYAEFQGYPGVVPASAIDISNKVTKKSVTLTFKSLEAMHQCVRDLRHLAPKAGVQIEPRIALLNCVGREGIANKTSREMRSGVQVAFAAAHTRMTQLKALVEREHQMLQDQGDKAVLMCMPQRQVMAKDLKNMRASTLIKEDETALQVNEADHNRGTSATPPASQKPWTPTSSRRQRAMTLPNLSPRTGQNKSPRKGQDKSETGKTKKPQGRLVNYGECAICEKHGQCLVSVPKYCNRCALKSVNDNLNKGDLREATVASNHVKQLAFYHENIKEITVGEHAAYKTRCSDSLSRVQEAARLNDVRELFRAAQAGDVKSIYALAESGVDVTSCVGNVEWKPGTGFLTTREALRGFSAVHFACMAFTGLDTDGKKEALMTLINVFGLNPHAPANDGRRAVHIAVNELPCLKYLIARKNGNAEWRDSDGRTVLHHAAMYGSLDCRIFLIGVCDAKHTVKDNFNKTPLDYNEDLAMIVRKKRSVKMICAFFTNTIVMKCFFLMKKYRKPEFIPLIDFVTPEKRKQDIILAARVVRRRLYQDWVNHGHPRLLKPWSSLLHQRDELGLPLSLQSELSTLTDMEWTNALEWVWYIGHDNEPLSPMDSPLWEVWDGDAGQFEVDQSLINREVDEDLNMTLAEQGRGSLRVSAFVIHYDAKVVYSLESRPPTSEGAGLNGIGRVRTPKDVALRTLKPNVTIRPDGQEDRDGTEKITRTGSLWSRVKDSSFTRALSFTRVLSGTSQAAASQAAASQVSKDTGPAAVAASLTRMFSFGSSRRLLHQNQDAGTGTNDVSASGDGAGGSHTAEEVSLGAKAVAASFAHSLSSFRRKSPFGSQVRTDICHNISKETIGGLSPIAPSSPIPRPPSQPRSKEEKAAVALIRGAASFKRSIAARKETE